MKNVWGIHNDALTSELIDGGFVSIGWERVGNLLEIGPDRDALKAAQKTAYPETKPGAVPVQAGTLYRFAFEIVEGDVVVAPVPAGRHDQYRSGDWAIRIRRRHANPSAPTSGEVDETWRPAVGLHSASA